MLSEKPSAFRKALPNQKHAPQGASFIKDGRRYAAVLFKCALRRVFHISPKKIPFAIESLADTDDVLFFQIFFHILSGVRLRILRHLFRRPVRDHGSAAVSALRSQINDVVRRLDHVQIVFNDNYSVPAI